LTVCGVYFSTFKALTPPAAPIEYDGKVYLVQVTSIEKPDMDDLEERIERYQQRERQNSSRVLIDSIVNRLKEASEIEIAPGIIG